MGRGGSISQQSEGGYLKGGDGTLSTVGYLPQQNELRMKKEKLVVLGGGPHQIEKPRFRPKGMTNVGNSCYANAVLQCLMSTALTQALMDPSAAPVFREYSFNLDLLRKGSGSVDEDDMGEEKVNDTSTKCSKTEKELEDKCIWLTRELQKLTLSYVTETSKMDMVPSLSDSLTSLFYTHEGPIINPESLTRHPHRISRCLRPYQQEDAHEFLRAMLGTLAMNGRNRETRSLFDGLLESSITCKSCGNKSLTRDRYMDLSLDIQDDKINSLEQAMAHFVQTETLNGANKVDCSGCKTKCTAKKTLRLATAPSILVCHLKRFSFNVFGGLTKITKKVMFPETLEITDYMSNLNQSKPPPYELVAVLVHQGKTCERGHYVAFVKSEGEWFRCDDKDVQMVPVEKVMSQRAYILMYEVADMRENHGFPSPSGKNCDDASTGSHSSQQDLFLGLCGMDTCCVFSPPPEVYVPEDVVGNKQRSITNPEINSSPLTCTPCGTTTDVDLDEDDGVLQEIRISLPGDEETEEESSEEENDTALSSATGPMSLRRSQSSSDLPDTGSKGDSGDLAKARRGMDLSAGRTEGRRKSIMGRSLKSRSTKRPHVRAKSVGRVGLPPKGPTLKKKI